MYITSNQATYCTYTVFIKMLILSVSCQLADIGSHSQLSSKKNWCISKQTHSFVRNLSQEKHLQLEKSYAHRQVC